MRVALHMVSALPSILDAATRHFHPPLWMPLCEGEGGREGLLGKLQGRESSVQLLQQGKVNRHPSKHMGGYSSPMRTG
jgi:hypothetical protein